MKSLVFALLLFASSSVGAGRSEPMSPPSPATTAAKKATQIAFEVTPATVVIFLDGQRLGTAAKVGTVRARPGRRIVRLEKGGDQTEMEVVVTKGKTLRFAYEFGE